MDYRYLKQFSRNYHQTLYGLRTAPVFLRMNGNFLLYLKYISDIQYGNHKMSMQNKNFEMCCVKELLWNGVKSTLWGENQQQNLSFHMNWNMQNIFGFWMYCVVDFHPTRLVFTPTHSKMLSTVVGRRRKFWFCKYPKLCCCTN